MTLAQKAGQLFCPCVFTNDPDELKAMVRRYGFGGLMFRAGPAKEVQAAVEAMQEETEIPLLISANLEDGGNGVAVEGTYMGRPMLAAATGDTKHAYRLGKVCGAEGAAVGVNWAFSPVVDVDLDYHNPITNVRTYGSCPDTVLSMGRAYIRGLSEEGIIPSIKHYPGDGHDERDQHLLTSVNAMSLEEWEAVFGRVYRGLIEDGALTVMAGHIAMPAMEEFYDKEPCKAVIPASCSANALRYLREELGFDGLIVTDASPMVGFTSAGRREAMVPMAIQNGCDMFLFNKDLDEDVHYMLSGIEKGLLTMERLDEAVTRILALKAAAGLHKRPGNESRRADLSVLGCERHTAWARECADSGVTLVKDTQGLLPLDPAKHRRVLLQVLGDFDSNERVTAQFEALLKSNGFEVERYVPETLETIFLNGSVRNIRASYDLVFYIGNIENASNKTVSRISWHTLFGAGNNLPWFVGEVPAVFVSVGNPYLLLDAPMIKTYVNGYCHSPAVIEAVMDKLLGRSRFTGVSPVDPFCGKWDTRL
jgi:beta-N-acetylhexosaminidase